MMPTSFVRLSAGRTEMSDEMQAMCFFAGANSIFCGDTLLTADNPGEDKDTALFARLGIRPMSLGDEALDIETPNPDGHHDHGHAGESQEASCCSQDCACQTATSGR